MVAVPVCGVCRGSHGDHAVCPGSPRKESDAFPLTVDAESLVIEMQSVRATPVGPGARLGAFELLEEIGAGGMGRVFRAMDTALQREVAIKLISPEFLLGNKQAVDRFLAEARLTARIRHPNVVPVHHLGADPNGNPFLVMELLQGRTLAAAVLAREAFPVSRIVSIGSQVLSALAAAHKVLVHRDLKSGNVILGPGADGEDRVTVLDFGIARALNDAGAELTRQQKRFVGTPVYAAPEMLLGTGSRDDPRQDLYALGVVLFALATGKFPWSATDIENLPRALRDGRKPHRLRAVARDADPSLADVVDRALAVDPAERWQSASEFRTALRSLGVFAPGVLVGETYRIERQLGQGGMSVVYLAHDVRMERSCALKALLVMEDEDPGGMMRERFRRDGALAKDVRHPNVVEVYAQGVWQGRPYIVTEFVDGKTLRETLGTLDWPSWVAVIRQIAAALDAVHAAGIVHRDVKPENILVDGKGVAKLVDFGFARRATSELTGAGIGLGSLGYIAPEQAADPTHAGPRSDEWALAAIAYEALTGRRPFYDPPGPADSVARDRYLDRLLNVATPEEPEKLNPSVSPQLSAVLVRALSQDVGARFETCGAFADAVAAAPSVAVGLMARTGAASPLAAGEAPSESLSAALVIESPEDRPNTHRLVSWRAGAVALAVLSMAGAGGAFWLRSSGRPSASELPSPSAPAIAPTASSPVALPDAAMARAAWTAAPDAGPSIDEGMSASPPSAAQPEAAPSIPKRPPVRKSHHPAETAPKPPKKPDPATDKDGVIRI